MKQLIFLLSGLVFLTQPLRGAPPAFRENAKAPDVTIEMLDGGQVRLSKCRGQVVLLCFWATWCKPCMKELSEVPGKILEPFAGRKLRVIAVSKGEPRATVEKRVSQLRERGLVFPVGLDPYGKISQMTGDERIPQMIVIGPDGVVRCHCIGYAPESLAEVAVLIEKLLKE